MDSENPTTDLLNILSKAMDAKVYGSIEIYLEDGQITQISQRVIKKIKRNQTRQIKIKKTGSTSIKNPRRNLTLELHN